MNEDENLNIWDPTKKYVGRWKITVLWYELPAEGKEDLILVQKSFSSTDDMNDYIEPLIQDDTIFDIFGTIESSWVEEEGDSKCEKS